MGRADGRAYVLAQTETGDKFTFYFVLVIRVMAFYFQFVRRV